MADIQKRTDSRQKRSSRVSTDSSGEELDSFASTTSSFYNGASSETVTKRSSMSDNSSSNPVRKRSSTYHSIPSNSDINTAAQNGEEESEDIFSSNPGCTLLLVLSVYMLLLYGVYLQFPAVGPQEREFIKIPFNLQEAKILAIILDSYTGQHYYTVLFAFCLVYIFLQTFSVPGSIFLSIMAGFLFPFKTALILICFCAATGASGCYMLSSLFGKRFLQRRFPDEIRQWTAKVDEERDNLLNFMIFLRITPILPNWFINIASPLIGVPLGVFWLGTFIGVAPPSVLAVQGGKTLNVMTSPSDHISWGSIIVLGILALIVLIPVYFRRRSQAEATTPTATNT